MYFSFHWFLDTCFKIKDTKRNFSLFEMIIIGLRIVWSPHYKNTRQIYVKIQFIILITEQSLMKCRSNNRDMCQAAF